MNESSIQFVDWQNPNPSCPPVFSWHPGFYAPAGNAGWIPVPASARTGFKTAGMTVSGRESRKLFHKEYLF